MKHKDDLKLTWLTIKQILRTKKSDSFTELLTANGNVITESSRIAEEFNNYFINIPPKLVDKIPHSGTYSNYSDFLLEHSKYKLTSIISYYLGRNTFSIPIFKSNSQCWYR